MSQASFYDDVAEYYDLIYPDWEVSMRRHGAAISSMLTGRADRSVRLLDISAGIGTQVLPLAALGYSIVARDLSERAIDRLKREAECRGLGIDAAQADMREVTRSVSGSFDAVLSFDNSIPHLLKDEEILEVFRGVSGLLKPGASLLVSVRDYDSVDRRSSSIHRYGERTRDGRRFRLAQEWVWLSETHYRTTMMVEEHRAGEWTEVVRTQARYYAIRRARLAALMAEAGLQASWVEEVSFFQPVLRGRAV